MKNFKVISNYFVLLVLTVFYQNNFEAQAFEKGKDYFSIGTGIGFMSPLELKNYKKSNDNYKFRALALNVKYGLGVTDKIEAGLSVILSAGTGSFTHEDLPEDSLYQVGGLGYSIMLRANYHFWDHDLIDPYFGAGIGYRTNDWEPNFTKNLEEIKSVIPIGFEASLGVRLQMPATNVNGVVDFGTFFEVGFGRTNLQFGLFMVIG